MRVKSLAFAASLLSLSTAPAMAQLATGIVEIDGKVADRCLFTTPSDAISIDELSLGGTGTQAGRLDVAKLNGQTRTLVAWCNGTAATVAVEALPLINRSFSGTAPAGFDTRINYMVNARANGATATDTSITPGSGTIVSVGLFTGDVVVNIAEASTPTNGLLVAGAYSAKIIVTLTPNVSFGGSGR